MYTFSVGASLARDMKVYIIRVGLKPHHDLHIVYTVNMHSGRGIPDAGRVGLNRTCDSCVLYMHIARVAYGLSLPRVYV